MTPEDKLIERMMSGKEVNRDNALAMGVVNIRKTISTLRESHNIHRRRTRRGPQWYMEANR